MNNHDVIDIVNQQQNDEDRKNVLLNSFNILDTLVICNIVATCNVGIENMSILSMIASNSLMYYNPAKFHALKNRFPGSTGRLFETGNVVCTGNKSYADVLITCHSISYLLRRMGIYAVTDCIRTQNMILGVSSPYPINLAQLYDIMTLRGHHMIYNPATFPGCIFKSKKPKYTIVTYASGEMIITGCLGFESMAQMVQQFFRDYIILCLNYNEQSNGLTNSNMFSENTIKKLLDTIKEYSKDN